MTAKFFRPDGTPCTEEEASDGGMLRDGYSERVVFMVRDSLPFSDNRRRFVEPMGPIENIQYTNNPAAPSLRDVQLAPAAPIHKDTEMAKPQMGVRIAGQWLTGNINDASFIDMLKQNEEAARQKMIDAYNKPAGEAYRALTDEEVGAAAVRAMRDQRTDRNAQQRADAAHAAMVANLNKDR